MASGRYDFDWLLDHAKVIAFDPGRLSLYVFSQDMAIEDVRERVLAPMNEAGLFSLSAAKFIEADRLEQYRGQLVRVALMVFDVAGQQCGIVMTYHDRYQPDLGQYEAWSRFWHERCLQAARAS